MAIVIANGIKSTLLAQLRTYLNGLWIRLFKNNLVPTGANVAADFVEANFDGYAAIALNSFGVPFLSAGNLGETDAGNITWTMTGVTTPNDVYGYFVTDLAGNLVYSDRNANAPVHMSSNGQQYIVAALMQLGTGPGT